MKKAKCPVCGASVELEEGLEIGETIYCSECDRDLRIISFSPPKLKEVNGISRDYVDEVYDEHEA